MKPSELNPLFSDEEITPEEIARARRIVAYHELKEAAAEYRKLMNIWRSMRSGSQEWGQEWQKVNDCERKIAALALELFPE